jgi:transposase
LDIERRLVDTGRRFAETSGERDKARQELYAAIRKAHREGMSIRRIAELAGVSHQRVHQVLHE